MRIIITDDKLRHEEVLVIKNPNTDKAQSIYTSLEGVLEGIYNELADRIDELDTKLNEFMEKVQLALDMH